MKQLAQYTETFFRLLLIGLIVLCVKCVNAQCLEDVRLIRKDTLVDKGIFVLEPKEGFRARVTFEPVFTITNSYDNIDTQMIYSAGWNNGPTTAPGFTNNTIAWSAQRLATLSFTFMGKRLEWLSEFKTTHGRASVTVNGVERIINLAASNAGPSVVAEWNLPQGTYTVVIKVFDNKAVVHDSFRVTSQ